MAMDESYKKMKTYTRHGNRMFFFKYKQTTIQIEQTESDPVDWVFDSHLYWDIQNGNTFKGFGEFQGKIQDDSSRHFTHYSKGG